MEIRHMEGNKVEKFMPSYENYRKILRAIKKTGKCMGYHEAKKEDSFLILRHDIEFSIDRAYKMALIEQEEEIESTFFLQITNNAYNAFSSKNIELIHRMIKCGHKIGLHYHLTNNIEKEFLEKDIQKQMSILSSMLNYKIDMFSIHRPTEESQYYLLEIEGIINAYGKDFFSHTVDLTGKEKLKVKYIADSKHQWNYGYPEEKEFLKYPKIQLLIHPYSWSECGEDALNTFNDLINEKEDELLKTFDIETKIFDSVKKDLIRMRRK